MTRRLKDPLLEKYLTGSLDEAARREVEEALARSTPDRERLRELEAEDAAFLARHPPAAFVAKTLGAPKPRASWRWWLPGLVAATAALLLVVFRPREPELLAKGDALLVVHVRTSSGSAVLPEGRAVAPGTALRFELRAPQPGYGAVYLRGERGVVVVAPRATMASPSGLFEEAVEVDSASGPERFVAVWASEAFAIEDVRRRLETGSPVAEGAKHAVVIERLVPKSAVE